jgi:hypothetical protein
MDIDIRHRITASELRHLLTQLRDDDVLEPNAVGNLRIIRDGESIGFVDLLPACLGIHLWETVPPSE